MGLGQSTETKSLRQGDRPEDAKVAVVDMEEVDRLRENMIRTEEKKLQGLTRLLTVANTKRKDMYNDDFDYHKESMGLLKQIFKKMDPSITRSATYTTHGELELSIKYDPGKAVLLVKIIRARDLDAKDLRGKSADAYVKIFMLPNSPNRRATRTKTIKCTLNPVYHEIFAFQITPQELQTGSVVCQVWDSDLLSKDDFIGEALVELTNLGLEDTPVYTGWYTLKAETDMQLTGDLEVTLTYQLPNILSVTVHCGNNLTNRYEEGLPNPFVKLQVPGMEHVFQTKVQENTLNPVWEQTFEFPVPQEEFEFRYLVLHAVDFDDASKNESMGQTIIELNNFDPEVGFHGHFDLSDLKNSERTRAKWFQDATVQEFQESLVAHACARYPKFLFQKQSGSKMIRVRNLKARSEAKLRIIDGVAVY